MDSPLVSVVIPSRNRADMLLRCLDALAAQTYPAIELVVVDDASSDDTQAALARFAEQHPRLGLIALQNSPQRGANPSRNRGIAASHGSLVAFEDDDCIAEPGWIEALVRGFVSERVGAVTGIVLDPEPRNIFDLAFRGTHRVYGEVHATRLIAGNMCVRRELLTGKLDEDRAAVSSDLSVSGRGDEEDLFLKLKAEGYEVRVAHDARVLHVHYYTRRTFFRQAWKSGGSAAKVGYKYHLRPRVELLCLAGGYAFALGAWVNPVCLLPSAACFGAFAAGALVYNEIWRKKKTPGEALRAAPALAAYYHVRAAGYLLQYARLLLGIDRLERVSLERRVLG
jgi:glycosyltransferase involved in cell wall biosynthesis